MAKINLINRRKLSKKDRLAIRNEVQEYKSSLKSGWGDVELPEDISLRVELAEIEYDPNKYLNRGVYSNLDIKEALLDGHIVIYPYSESQLNPASYNFVLGEHTYVIDTQLGTFHNMFDSQDIEKHYRKDQAISHKQWSAQNHGTKWENIPEDTPMFVFGPHQQNLNHSHEFIGIKGPGTTRMYARSTTGRNAIQVCRDAGLGDPGYINRWTVETENGRNQTTAIPVGYEVGQFVFEGTGRVAGSYEDTGSYQRSASLLDLIKDWKPEMMLPKARPDQIHQLKDLQNKRRRSK